MELRIKLEGAEELQAALRRLGSEAQTAMADAALAGAEVIRDAATRRAPGPYIRAEVVRTTRQVAQVHIGPDEDHWYYQFVETGAQPHLIRPRKPGGKLRFEVGGAEVFARVVHHPGMAARPFLRPAFDENSGRAADAAGRRLRGKLGL